MESVMICLVGAQPLANLLPIRHCRPDTVVLLHTDWTEATAKRLYDVIAGECHPVLKCTNAYEMAVIRADVGTQLEAYGAGTANAVFNLTGGTKAMVLAAFEVAQKESLPVLYLQSEGRQSRLYRYRIDVEGLTPDGDPVVVAPALSLDEYLRLHLGPYKQNPEGKSPGHRFERLAAEALSSEFALIRNVAEGNLEIDLVLQYENHVGVVEIGTGNEARRKHKLEQLSLAAQRLQSTYLRRIWIATQPVPNDIKAIADAAKIRIIELCRSEATEAQVRLDPADAAVLVESMTAILAG